LVALEDILAAEISRSVQNDRRISLSKPHPFALLEAVRRITAKERVRGAYIGDTPDDIRAANAAKHEMDFVAIGCLAAAEDKDALRREFERVGADVIVAHPDALAELIEN
ncbi:MAG: HAD hydrolase-like protein, partial [Anaerolineales bacterium]|nr:HAD hydrolase-like protein [Anaerolineales bacterium]